MTAQLRALLRLDLEAVDVKGGLTGLASVLAFAAFVAIFGEIGMVAALATVFVILADHPGPLRERGIGMLVMTVVGTIIALIGVWAGTTHLIVSAALTFVVVALATLSAGFGPAYATRGMLLSVWAVVAISLAGEGDEALQLAVAFAGGGIIAAAAVWLRTRALPEPTLREEAGAAERDITTIARSPLGWFSLLRAGAAAIALWLGGTLFPDHAIWAALTVVLVMKPKAGEALVSGLLRTIGTVVGVVVAELLIALAGGQSVILLIGFLASAFAMAALQKVNYAVFVAGLTAMLVLAAQLATGTGESTASDRLLATIIGAAIAFAGIGIGRAMLGRPIAGSEPGPDGPGDDPTPG